MITFVLTDFGNGYFVPTVLVPGGAWQWCHSMYGHENAAEFLEVLKEDVLRKEGVLDSNWKQVY